MATEAARLKNQEPQEGRRKTVLTLTGLLMEGVVYDNTPEPGSSYPPIVTNARLGMRLGARVSQALCV